MQPVRVARYTHFRYEQNLDSEEAAREMVAHLKEITEFLSKEYPVYVRRTPQYQRDNDFASNVDNFFVSTRFSVGFKDMGVPPGLKEVSTVYCNGDLLYPFGLTPINEPK